MIGALRTRDDDRWYRLAIGALVLGAWAALAAWGASPYADRLDHAGLADGSALARMPAFVVGWTLMTIAMMLPSSLPLVNLFRRVSAARDDRSRLLAALLVGYLGVWAGFGLAAFAADAAIHSWLADRPGLAWLLAPTVVLAAGAYQFTPLKHACLEQCRSPYSFLVGRWRGPAPLRQALRLGLDHGLFCLGCCWSLMLLMFALGGASLAWMLGLGALMAAERATTWGRHLTRPIGFALVAWGTLQIVRAAAF
jgi:predicted metal-binding membrane protein